MFTVTPTTVTTPELEAILINGNLTSVRIEKFIKEYATRTDRNEELRIEMGAGTIEKLRQYEMFLR